MIDVEHFLHIVVDERVRHRPADAAHLLEVDGALIMGVVELSGAGQRIVAGRIDVIGQLALGDLHVVALNLVEEGPVALDRTSLLQRPHHLVVARLVERLAGASRLQRAEHWRPLVAFVVPELVFLPLLNIDRHRNRKGERAEVGALGCQPEAAALRNRASDNDAGQREEPCSNHHEKLLERSGRRPWGKPC